MKLPTLYKKTSTGAIQFWKINVFENSDHSTAYDIVTEFGQVGTDSPQTAIETVFEGKNLGKANKTTPFEQAESQAQSEWTRKKERHGYVEDLERAEAGETDCEGGIAPMLAKDYEKAKKHLKFPCLIQRKYDGCLFRTSVIKTDQGSKTIEEIVKNKLKVKVLSFNELTGECEYKNVINWFDNGKIKYKEWIEIVPEIGKPLKCTKNHKIMTNEGWIEAQFLDPKNHKIFSDSGNDYRNGLIAGTVIGDSLLSVEKRGSGTSYRLIFQHTNKDLFNFKVQALSLEGTVKHDVITGYGSLAERFTSRALTNSNFPIKLFYHIGHSKGVEVDGLLGKRKVLTHSTLKKILTKESVAMWIADDGSLRYNNDHKHTPILNISTHNHSEEQISEFVYYFKTEWESTPTPILDKRVNTETGISGKYLNFNTKDTLYILNQLRRLQIKGAEYKYYFPTEGYVTDSKAEPSWCRFTLRKSCRMSDSTKYDIEVEDNHNYFANNTLVHNCRAIAVYEDGKCTLWSRKREQMHCIPHVEKAIEELFKGSPNGVILDGEIYVPAMSMQSIASFARQKTKPKDGYEILEYHIYDIPSLNETNYKRSEALKFLQSSSLFKHPLVAVPTLEVHSLQEIELLHDQWVQDGYEGAILRNENAKYEAGKRSSNLLKYKKFDTNEFIITSVKEGVGKFDGLAIFVCSMDNGDTFDCCAPGTLENKREAFAKSEEFIGKELTVKHFGYTDLGFPRFPVPVAVRDYE